MGYHARQRLQHQECLYCSITDDMGATVDKIQYYKPQNDLEFHLTLIVAVALYYSAAFVVFIEMNLERRRTKQDYLQKG